MKIIDAHCDTLGKLVQDSDLSFYRDNPHLHVQYSFMLENDIAIQAFAVFVPPGIPPQQRFHAALQMIDKFYEDVIRDDVLQPVLSAGDVGAVLKDERMKGGMLTLEGADALQGNISYLRILYRLGVRAVGFTWNYRNEAADGVEEPNPGGLSLFGRKLLKEANRLGIILDVSHLSEKGFWDVLELSDSPVIASHSNCFSVCSHRRNLNDSQMTALFKNGGVMGLTFVPGFISSASPAGIPHLLKHLDHVLALGGEDHVAFGSDFDGISQTMCDLTTAEQYHLLVNTLLKQYKDEQVKKWLSGNWQRVICRILG